MVVIMTNNKSRREILANEIYVGIQTHPDAVSNFVCAVSDHVSLIELEMIKASFIQSLQTIYNKQNLNN